MVNIGGVAGASGRSDCSVSKWSLSSTGVGCSMKDCNLSIAELSFPAPTERLTLRICHSESWTVAWGCVRVIGREGGGNRAYSSDELSLSMIIGEDELEEEEEGDEDEEEEEDKDEEEDKKEDEDDEEEEEEE